MSQPQLRSLVLRFDNGKEIEMTPAQMSGDPDLTLFADIAEAATQGLDLSWSLRVSITPPSESLDTSGRKR